MRKKRIHYPQVNWTLTDKTKAIYDAFRKEKNLGKNDAANEMILEFGKWHPLPVCKRCKGGGYIMPLVDGIAPEDLIEVCTDCNGLGKIIH